MERFARWIVKHRKTVLVIAVLLLIPSVFEQSEPTSIMIFSPISRLS